MSEARPVPIATSVPGWLREYDRDWRALRDDVLDAHRDAEQALHLTVHAYRDSEAYAVALIKAAADPAADPAPASIELPTTLPARAVADSGAGDPSGSTRYGGADAAVAGHDLDSITALWRRRRDSAGEAEAMLRHALTRLSWQGAAAAEFTAWAQVDVARCAALTDSADTAHTALSRRDPADPGAIAAPRTWPQRSLPTVPTQRRDPLGPAMLAGTGGATSPVSPPIPSVLPAPTDAPPDAAIDAGAPSTAPGAEDSPDRRPDDLRPADGHPDHEHLDDEYLELVNDGSVLQSSKAEGDGATSAGDVVAAVASTLPVAAIASTALFARTDRAHHIVRDILLPPAGSGFVPHPGTTARRFATTGAPDYRPSSTAGPHATGDPASPGHTAPPEGPLPLGRPMAPFHDAPAAVWINLARADDPPAWVDLAAARGLGLDGPGALDIARTLWRRLHDDHPAALLIAPHQTARRLLGDPLPRRHIPQHRVLIVEDPRHGLTESRDEIERRRTVGRHTAPVVLLVPTPVTIGARADLASALQFPSAAFAAVVLGRWDTGTTLVITDNHHVSEHRRAAPGLPPLTGTRLEPTTVAALHAPDPPAPDRPDTAEQPVHDRTEAEPADPQAPVEPRVVRTPLALSVLGTVQLRYRTPITAAQPNGADEVLTEQVQTVSGLSRPAQELLAYLAAHPGGATRDAAVEALWPDSAADRPDTAFHATISRLRKRLREVTGTDTAGELITATDGRWHLNRAQVTVDYWTFLETHPRNPDSTLRHHDHRVAVQLYQGPYACDVTAEWVHTIREATRRRYLEAINDLTETEIATTPDLALELLERARNLEPLNEAIYRNIIRIHLDARRLDAARGIYELLRTHLAIIEATPDLDTERLAALISRPRQRQRS